MRSFRSRIIFWTIVISGAVMLGFGASVYVTYERIKLGQVDDLLEHAAGRPVHPLAHSRHWERMGEAMARELEAQAGAEAMVVVYSGAFPEKEPELRSDAIRWWGNWGNAFGGGEARFPEAEGEMDMTAFPPDPSRHGPPPFGPGGGGRFEDRFRPAAEVSLVSLESGSDGSGWRFALSKFDGYNVVLGVSLSAVNSDVALMRNAFAITFPAALLTLGCSIWFFVTRAISPLGRLATTIGGVTAKRLDARIESSGDYVEFARLIDLFNEMLDRLEKSFMQATRFSADAAHELKTPLTILQGQLEQALQEAPDDSPQQRQLAELLDEAHRLKSITRKLLLLARADAGRLELQLEAVDLRALVEDCIEVAAEGDSQADIEFELAEGRSFVVDCDESLTRQIVQNILANALKYRYPADSRVLVRLASVDSELSLEIENRCRPLASEKRERLFDRFARGDEARSREEDGTGLGLSLSLEFARAQKGDLVIVDDGDDAKMVVRFLIPKGRGLRG